MGFNSGFKGLNKKLRNDVSYAIVVLSCGQTVAATAVFLSVSPRYDKMDELQTPKLSDSMQIHYKSHTVCLRAAETPIMCVSEPAPSVVWPIAQLNETV